MRGIKTCGIFVLGAACGILGVFALIWASSPQQHQTPMVQHDLLAAITKVHDAVRLVDIIVEKSIYVLDELGMLQSKQEAVDSFAKNLIGDSRIFLYPRQQAAVEIQRTILDTDTLRPLLHPKLSIPFTTKQIVNKKAIQIERIKWMYTIDRAVENERDRVTSNVADLSRSINKLLVTEYLTPSDVPDWKTDITCHWDKSCDINGKLHANLNTTMLLGLARVCWPLHQNRIALLELQEAYSDLHDACAGDWSSNYRAAVTDFGREVVDELLEAAGVQIARTGALFNNDRTIQTRWYIPTLRYVDRSYLQRAIGEIDGVANTKLYEKKVTTEKAAEETYLGDTEATYERLRKRQDRVRQHWILDPWSWF